jgi:hypothetical protein
MQRAPTRPDFGLPKKLTKTILVTLGADVSFFGLDNIQMHHGGSFVVV